MVQLDHTRRTWAEAVCHVLAHVDAGPLPSSLHGPRYVHWVSGQLGAASERELGDDARVLAAQLRLHADLARVQALAGLFTSHERALAVQDRELDALTAADVDRPQLLASLRQLGAPAELLFCAALLELPRLLTLEAPTLHPDLEQALESVSRAAPRLRSMRIAGVRPLGACGRVYRDEIWLGTPLDGFPDAAHGSFQAAHEATVMEVQERAGRQLRERQVEAVAIVQLASRAHDVGLGHAHAAWYGRLRNPPAMTGDALPSGLSRWLE